MKKSSKHSKSLCDPKRVTDLPAYILLIALASLQAVPALRIPYMRDLPLSFPRTWFRFNPFP